MRWLVLPLLLLGLPVAVAEEGDFDTVVLADEVVRAAVLAERDQDWPAARRLAEQALALDDSSGTARVRLVLARALAAEGALESALYELRQYLLLPLSPEELAAGHQLMGELEAGDRRAARLRRRFESGAWRRDGIGLVIGGLAPLGVGGWFVGTDVGHAASASPSGTWAVIGAPLLAVGVVLEIGGIASLADPRIQALRRASLGASLLPAPGGAVVALGGRF